METNVKTFSEKNKAPLDLETETKGSGIREEIKDTTIRRISVQRNALRGHANFLKEELNYELKEANYTNWLRKMKMTK